MKPTQGVILIMIAALILYLTWSSKSALKSSATGSSSTATPSGTTGPGTWVAPWLPPEARTCADNGGHWNMFTGTCDGISGQGSSTPNGSFVHTPDGIHKMADIANIGGVPTWAGGPYSGVPVAKAPANAGDLTPYLSA